MLPRLIVSNSNLVSVAVVTFRFLRDNKFEVRTSFRNPRGRVRRELSLKHPLVLCIISLDNIRTS
jgi:hypothetical protein